MVAVPEVNTAAEGVIAYVPTLLGADVVGPYVVEPVGPTEVCHDGINRGL